MLHTVIQGYVDAIYVASGAEPPTPAYATTQRQDAPRSSRRLGTVARLAAWLGIGLGFATATDPLSSMTLGEDSTSKVPLPRQSES